MPENIPTVHEELARLRHADILSEARKRQVALLAAECVGRVPLHVRAGATVRDARHAAAAGAHRIVAAAHRPRLPAGSH